MQHKLDLNGSTIPTDVHLPPGLTRSPNASMPGLPALILLHGAGGNVSFWLDRLAPQLTAAGVAVFAPHYFARTGTTYADLATITDGVHVPLWLETLAAAHCAVADWPGIDRSRIVLVGISLGAFLSMSYAALRSSAQAGAGSQTAADKTTREPAPSPAAARDRRDCPLRCVVELSGGLPEPYASHATAALPPTLILHGEADTIVPVSHARALDHLLTRLGVPHETHLLPGEGHWFGPAAQTRLLLAVASFLSRHLQLG